MQPRVLGSVTCVVGTVSDSTAADVYSYGIMLWAIVTGLRPYNDVPSVWDIPRLVIDKRVRPEIPESLPPGLARLIQRCWAHEPGNRPSFEVSAGSGAGGGDLSSLTPLLYTESVQGAVHKQHHPRWEWRR